MQTKDLRIVEMLLVIPLAFLLQSCGQQPPEDDDKDGEWEPPQIDNPDYKGEWKPRQIKNPDYKGPWMGMNNKFEIYIFRKRKVMDIYLSVFI